MKCDHYLDKNREYCMKCGIPVISKKIICIKCGKEMKKVEPHTWECPCMPGLYLSIG